MNLILKRTVYRFFPYLRVDRFGGLHQESDPAKAATFPDVESASAFLLKRNESLERFTYLDWSNGVLTPVSPEALSYDI